MEEVRPQEAGKEKIVSSKQIVARILTASFAAAIGLNASTAQADSSVQIKTVLKTNGPLVTPKNCQSFEKDNVSVPQSAHWALCEYTAFGYAVTVKLISQVDYNSRQYIGVQFLGNPIDVSFRNDACIDIDQAQPGRLEAKIFAQHVMNSQWTRLSIQGGHYRGTGLTVYPGFCPGDRSSTAIVNTTSTGPSNSGTAGFVAPTCAVAQSLLATCQQFANYLLVKPAVSIVSMTDTGFDYGKVLTFSGATLVKETGFRFDSGTMQVTQGNVTSVPVTAGTEWTRGS